MTPQERIEADLKAALKAGEKDRLATLRMLLTDIKNERIKKGHALDETEFVAVLRRSAKQRSEAAEQYRQGNRPELAEKEERELELIEEYLPAPVDEGVIRQAVEEYVAAEGLRGPKAMGQVMKAIMAKFAGSADGKTINRIAREVLSEE